MRLGFCFAAALLVWSTTATAEQGALFKLKRLQQGPSRQSAPVDAFISGSGLEALKAELKARGAVVSGDDKLLWVRAPIETLAALHGRGNVARIEASPALAPLLDQSVKDIGGIDVHMGQHLKTKRTGRGVMVGVLDTGIDLKHPAFLDEAGHSRIFAAWDQDADGVGPQGFGYGRLCDHGEIEAGTCPINDTQGHGTHVAGILAGNLTPHVGLAPDAQLLVVKSERFTDVAGAVEWMFRVADEQRKPIVVNLSLGGHLGAHDGQSELEQALDQLQGPGKIIVAAAGNDGATPIHLGTDLRGSEQRVELLLPPPGAKTSAMIDGWAPSPSALSFAVELRDSRGALLTRVALRDDGRGQSEDLRVGGASHGEVSYAADTFRHQRQHHVVVVDRSKASSRLNDERWFLVMSGEGRFDAWLSTDDYRYGNAQFSTAADTGVSALIAGDTQQTLTIPGTAKRVITVGAFVTKNHWSNGRGRSFELPQAHLFAISTFSSAGPTAAPELTGPKPDLIAPGQLIAAPLSSSVSGFSQALAIDEHFAVLQGTSMSSPHVAGTVALMLESHVKLTPEDAKSLLTTTADHDDADGAVPSERMGYGRLNALKALQALEGRPIGCHALDASDASVVAVLFVLRRRRRTSI